METPRKLALIVKRVEKASNRNEIANEVVGAYSLGIEDERKRCLEIMDRLDIDIKVKLQDITLKP